MCASSFSLSVCVSVDGRGGRGGEEATRAGSSQSKGSLHVCSVA